MMTKAIIHILLHDTLLIVVVHQIDSVNLSHLTELIQHISGYCLHVMLCIKSYFIVQDNI